MRLEAVGKRYGLRQPWVVRDVTQHLAAGRLIKVEGPNGSGKSTLLHVLAGATVPSAGRVTGRPRAGYVPERFPGGLGFSARDYLSHMSRIHGLVGAAATAAADKWLERLGATEYARAPLRTLSKGMCQKVAIAQALVASPDLLVLDEAWTGLDLAARGTLNEAVRERLSEGATVVFVDHDPVRLASRVDERWQLANGAVTVAADGRGVIGGAEANGGAAAGGAMAPTESESVATGGEATIIELTGLSPDSVARLETLPGVLSAQPGAADGSVRLTARAAGSDDVLRQVLSLDGVHVRALGAGSEGGP
jgi:ABC-type multidrug transport system ATPase subunit